jgi:hypothetical protein
MGEKDHVHVPHEYADPDNPGKTITYCINCWVRLS